MESKKPGDYRQILSDNESLAIFLESLKDFDSSFCDMMNSSKEFTLRLEVRGANGKLIHCRVSRDHFDRPSAKNGQNQQN